MRRAPRLFALAFVVAAGACGGEAPGASDWRAIASAAGKDREERIAEASRAVEGALGARLEAARAEDPEFAATSEAIRAAVAWIDAYRPGRPDATLVAVASRANRWPREVRAAALRALARLHEPSAVRLLGQRALTVDAAEDDHATAWVALAEALAPAGDEAARGKMAAALSTVAAQRAAEGQSAAAARSRALAARVAALSDPAAAPAEADVPRLRAALSGGGPDERAAAAAALGRIGTREAREAVAARLSAEDDPFVAHQLRRLAEGAAEGTDAPAPAEGGASVAFQAWARRRDEVEQAGGDDLARATRALEDEARAALARFLPAAADLAPPDRLAVARFADAVADATGLRRALATLAREPGEEGRVATTWIATLALQDRDPAGALVFLRRLLSDFDGRGLDAHGHAVPADVLAGAIVEEAAAAARRAMEGPSPDPAAASRALEVGREAQAAAPEDEEAEGRLLAAKAYVALSRSPFRPAKVGALVRGGPYVLVVADHFQLGEPVLPSVLARWKKGVDVVLVGLLRGHVRRGIRSFAAEPAEERAAIAEAAERIGVPLAGFFGPGGDEPVPPWLGDAPAALFVVAGDGGIAARAAGPSLDPRPLEPVVQPLSRDPAATAPPR